MKQPLGSIVANASAVRRRLKKSPPEVNEASAALENIIAYGHRASGVIESVRALFSKSDQGKTLAETNELIRERGELDEARVLVEYELNTQLSLLSAHKGQLQHFMVSCASSRRGTARSSSVIRLPE